MSVLILVDIKEDTVELVVQKLLGRSGHGSIDPEDLQGLLLKFGEDSKRLRTSVETFVD